MVVGAVTAAGGAVVEVGDGGAVVAVAAVVGGAPGGAVVGVVVPTGVALVARTWSTEKLGPPFAAVAPPNTQASTLPGPGVALAAPSWL